MTGMGLERKKGNPYRVFLSAFRGIKLLGEEEIRSEVKMILDLWLASSSTGWQSCPEEFFKKGPYNLAKSRKESEEDLDWAKIWEGDKERESRETRVGLKERRNGINGERREAGGRWKRRGRGGRKKEEEKEQRAGKTGERTEDIELKWPLGAHSSIPLSLP